jgi:ABC-type sugar transport system, permease component
MKRRLGADEISFNVIGYIFLGLIGLATIYPFLVLIGSSFASEHELITKGYPIIPTEPSLKSYGLIFAYPAKIIRAYAVTIFITVVGTAVSLFVSTMSAYVLARKSVKYRGKLAFFLYFTTLFSGGLAPYYIIIVSVLHLKNSILALLLVPMFNVFYILILKNYLKQIPDSLPEAAVIDGAGEFRIFTRIALPMSKPALASIGLFTALIYWNDWWTAMMFMDKEALQPLQYMLYRILSSVNLAANIVNSATVIDLPKESLKLALTVVSTGPIILLYPFVQRFFVKGVALGAVKE